MTTTVSVTRARRSAVQAFVVAATLVVGERARAQDVATILATPDVSSEIAAGQPPRRPTAPRPAQPSAPKGPAIRVQPFFSIDLMTFKASQSFNAILGTDRGLFYGGGVRIRHRSGVFGEVGVSHFSDAGTRAFVLDGKVYSLGIPTTIAMTPVDFTGGYEFDLRRRPSQPKRPKAPMPPPRRGDAATSLEAQAPASARPPAPAKRSGGFKVVPYVGGGFGFVRYSETAKFAASGDDSSERFKSYHVLGGVRFPWSALVGTAVDVHYRIVPDALGSGGVSESFGDTDLGGFALRIRVTVGR